jgi:outer membrane receptor protein involved in Fe transport
VEAARHVRDTDGTPAAQLTRQEDNHDQVLTPGLLVTGLWTGLDGTLKLTGGADAYQDDVASTKRERRSDKAWTWADLPRGSFSDGSTWRQTGAFGHADWDLWRAGDHTVTVSAGARGTATAAHAAGVPAVGDVDHAFAGAVGSAGLRWLLKDRAMTYVSLNQGFRAPNLQETTVLGNTGSKFEVPNGELKPERSDTLELGARLALPKVTLHAVGYMSRIADAIDERKLAQSEFAAFGVDAADVGCKAFDDPACKPIPVVQRVNAERGQVVGSEASAVVGPFAGASVWLQGMWLRGEVETPSLGKPAGETVPMRRMPPPQGSAGLRYERGTWRAEIGTRFAAAQDRLHPSDEDDLRMCENPAALGATYKATAGAPKCPGTPGWVTMDARVGTKLGDRFRADLALTNALDARYRTHASGLDAPGRSFVLTLVGER